MFPSLDKHCTYMNSHATGLFPPWKAVQFPIIFLSSFPPARLISRHWQWLIVLAYHFSDTVSFTKSIPFFNSTKSGDLLHFTVDCFLMCFRMDGCQGSMYGILQPGVSIRYLGDTVVVIGDVVVEPSLMENDDSFWEALIVGVVVVVSGSFVVNGDVIVDLCLMGIVGTVGAPLVILNTVPCKCLSVVLEVDLCWVESPGCNNVSLLLSTSRLNCEWFRKLKILLENALIWSGNGSNRCIISTLPIVKIAQVSNNAIRTISMKMILLNFSCNISKQIISNRKAAC